MRYRLVFLLGLALITSCRTRNLAYLSDVQSKGLYTEKVLNATEPKVQVDDLLSITVVSPSAESNSLFNRGEMPVAGVVSNYNANSASSVMYREGYLVDKDGFIDFPVLGKVKLGGLTKAEAKALLISQLDGYLKEPMVNIRYLNYKVTVMGEVNRPATFMIPTEKVTILEALGMAGDMTAFGRRENVMVIREVGGVRTITRLDLNKKDVLSSPFFYLQQNDVVYVEPDRVKTLQASTNTRNLSIFTTVLSLTSFVLFRLRII
jgi:polysaccharide biosynthesis/export protein